MKHLDIECEDEDTFHLLSIGFKLLLGDVLARRAVDPEAEQLGSATKRRRGLTGVATAWLSSMSFFEADYVDDDTADPALGLIDEKKRRSIVAGWRSMIPKLPVLSAAPSSSSSSSSSSLLPPAQFLGWKSAGTQIWARLKLAGLEVKCVFSWELSRVILKVRCPSWRLEEVAERIHLKLRRRDGQIRRFKISKRDYFMPAGADGCVFSSSERQRIIDFLIRSKIKDGGAELDEHTELGAHIVSRFPLHMQATVNQLRYSWVRFWKQEEYGVPAKPW